MLGSQTLTVGTFNKHLLSRKQKKGARKKALFAALTLTSMVDMFSLLVIFLLQSFSASPELVMVNKGVTLPAARTGAEMKDAPVLSLSQEGVFLDQKKVGSAEEILSSPDRLLKPLEDLRVKWMRAHPQVQFNGEINFQAHREISSVLVSQIMGLLPSQNYSTIELAVVAGNSK